MGNSHRLTSALFLVGQASVGVLAERNFRRLPVANSTGRVDAGPVSIVVPARNEAHRIRPLLESLALLEYPQVEIVVVDDESTDATAGVALRAGARLLSVTDLPHGWTGKSFACAQGADATTGEWILFTDADTVHRPKSLAAALDLARQHDADVVSLLCRQRCVTFWERLLLPYAYALYFVGRLRMNRSTHSAVANGQYVLVRRSSYERLGGHSAVRDSLIEDVALAQRAISAGLSVVLADGSDLVDVRMYENLRTLWEGFSKNSSRFVLASPATGLLTVLGSILFAASLPRAIRANSPRLRAAYYFVPAAALLPWTRRFGVGPGYALLYPLAAAVFGAIAMDSMRRSIMRGQTRWKGRRY